MTESTDSVIPVRLRKLLALAGWLCAGTLLLIIALTFTLAALINSASGRVWLVGVGQTIINNHTPHQLSIEGLKMPEMGRWQFSSLSVSGPQGNWLQVKSLLLTWNPYELLHRKLVINSLKVDQLNFDKGAVTDSVASPEDDAESSKPDVSIPWLEQAELGAVAIATLELKGLVGFEPIQDGDRFRSSLEMSANWRAGQQLMAEAQITTRKQVQQVLSVKLSSDDMTRVNLIGQLQESNGGALGAYLQLPEDDSIDALFDLSLQQRDTTQVLINRLELQIMEQRIAVNGAVNWQAESGSVELVPINFSIGDTQHHLSGHIGADAMDLDVSINQLPLEIFSIWLPQLEGGTLNAQVSLTGSPSAPQANADIDVKSAYAGQSINLQSEIRTNGQVVSIKSLLADVGSAALNARGNLNIDSRTIQGTVTTRSLDDKLLRALGVVIPSDLSFSVDHSEARLHGNLMRPDVDAHVNGSILYRDLPVQLSADLQTRDSSVNITTLQLTSDAASVSATGQIDMDAMRGNLSVSAVQLPLSLAGLAGVSVPPDVDLSLGAKVKIAGELTNPSVEATITGSGQLGKQPLTLEAVGGWRDQQLALRRLTLLLNGESSLDLAANYGPDAIVADVTLKQVNTAHLGFLQWPLPQGILNTELSLQGPPAMPDGQITLDFTVSAEEARKSLRGGQLSLQGKITDGQLALESQLSLNGNSSDPFRIQANLKPIISGVLSGNNVGTSPLDADVSGGLNLDVVSAFLPDASQSIQGKVAVDLNAAGSVAAPELNGTIRIENTGYTNYGTGTVISNLTCIINSTKYHLSFGECSGDAGDEGSIRVAGDIQLPVYDTGSLNISINARKASILNTSSMFGQLDGSLLVTGDFSSITIGGDLQIREFLASLDASATHHIPTIEVQKQPPAESSEAEDSKGPRVLLDVRLLANNKAYLRGRGLDAEMEGVILVNGTAGEPNVEGKLQTVRGSLTLFGKKFLLNKGAVEFSNDAAFLNLEALYRHSEQSITARLSGTPDQLQIRLSAQPAMPEDEILAYIIFGKSVQDISPVQALQLASAVNTLRGEGGFDPVNATRQLLGADTLYVESAEGGNGLNIGVGKYINEKVYLELQRTSNPSQPWKGQLEIELTPKLNLESSTGGKSGIEGAQLKWKHNY